MEINIKKHKKNKGKYFQKVPFGTDCSKCKQIAMKDITGNFERNYLPIENIVLRYCKYADKVLRII